MRVTMGAAVAVMVLAGLGPVAAQKVEDVKLSADTSGAMLSGSVTGHGFVDYRLAADGGRTMFVELSPSGEVSGGTAYFNVLPPGSETALYNSSVNGNEAVVDLPSGGTYTIRVYLMGNARDGGGTVSYELDISVDKYE